MADEKVKTKKRSRYVNMGMSAKRLVVFSATDSEQDDSPPPIRVRKPRKTKTTKKYVEQKDPDEDEDFEAGSSDDWQPEKSAPSLGNVSEGKKKKRTRKNKANLDSAVTSKAVGVERIVQPQQKMKTADDAPLKEQVEDCAKYGAIPRFSRKHGRPFKGFDDDPGDIFKVSQRRGQIDGEVLDTLLEQDALEGRNIGPGIIPVVAAHQELKTEESSLKPLLDTVRPVGADIKKVADPKVKEKIIEMVGTLMETLDPTVEKFGWRNSDYIAHLDRLYEKAAKKVTETPRGKEGKVKINEHWLIENGFGEVPLLWREEELPPLYEFGSDFEEKAKASGRNAGEWRKLTAEDVKMSPLDRLIAKFVHFHINGNQGKPQTVASWLNSNSETYKRKPTDDGTYVHTVVGDTSGQEYHSGIKIREDGTGIDCHAFCPKDELPAGQRLDAEYRKSVKEAMSYLFKTFECKLSALRKYNNWEGSNINVADSHNGNTCLRGHDSNMSGQLNCSICNYSTMLEHLLRSHVSHEHGTANERERGHFACLRSDNLKEHIAAKHGNYDDKKFKCPHCVFACVQSSQLKLHMVARHGNDSDRKFKCPHCDYASVQNGNLKLHIAAIHGNDSDRKFKCPHCDYASVQSGHLKEHIAAKHGNDSDRKFKCPHCDYASVWSGTLKYHIAAKHGNDSDRKFKCPHCDYASVQNGNLKLHIAARHGNDSDRKFKCPHCDYASVQSGHLKDHIAAKHGNDSDRKFKCPHCGYASVRSRSLKEHIAAIHGNDSDRKFKCPHCGYASVRSRSLKEHIAAIHGNDSDRKFKCPHCDYASVQSVALKNHIAAKHGNDSDRKFKCPHCDYASVQSGSLKVHIAARHGNVS